MVVGRHGCGGWMVMEEGRRVKRTREARQGLRTRENGIGGCDKGLE